MDHRQLLKKYIHLVGEVEGADYVDYAEDFTASREEEHRYKPAFRYLEFTDEEVVELEKIKSEIYGRD